MRTKNNSIRAARLTPWAVAALGALLFAARLQAQQVSTVIHTNLLEPNYVTTGPNNYIYFTDASNNRIVQFVPSTNGVITLAGLAGVNNSGTNNGPGSVARFSQPLGIVYDLFRKGLVVVDSANQALRFLTNNGSVTLVSNLVCVSNGTAAAAHFSYPAGITSDGAGNLFLADAGNNAIRLINATNGVSTVQVTNYAFSGPSAVALDNNSNLWVADTKNDTICVISNISVITNQSVTVVAGALRQPGTNDSPFSTNALFNRPSGLLWDPNGAGLFISDTANNTVRRLYPTAGGYSVETVAGLPGVAGLVDGAPSIAEFNGPVGLAVDSINNGYYVVDRANNALRRLQPSPPLPAVSSPRIGYVTFPVNGSGNAVSLFNPASSAVFNNAEIITVIAEQGTQTFMQQGATPANSYATNQIPDPGPNSGNSPTPYPGDGVPQTQFLSQYSSILTQGPDVTMKVIGVAAGRNPSSIVTAQFQFVTANPNITGNNAAQVTLSDNTAGALIYYTLDGSPPTNAVTSDCFKVPSNPGVISFDATSNVTLTVQAYADNFAPSGIATQQFSPSNYVADRITFGFASGEASSEFMAAAGQGFYAPVTLTLLPSATMYSLQFGVLLSPTNNLNLPTKPPPATNFTFQSMVDKPVENNLYQAIPPEMFTNMTIITNVTTNIVVVSNIITTIVVTNVTTNDGFQGLLFTNAGENLLGVGWLEIAGKTNLYDTGSQDLITYSMAHETLFHSSDGQVIVGAYYFQVPTNALTSQQYHIQLIRPSADGDGFAQAVFIQTPTNGSITAITNVTVTNTSYIVGDVAPFRWLNAGDFGDGYILNNDVLEVFRAAVYGLNVPPANSDFYGAMDSADGTINHLYDVADTTIDAAIDTIKMGDTNLDVTDVYVTYRRSLDPDLHWVRRTWANGVLTPTLVTNVAQKTKLSSSPASAPPTRSLVSKPRYITVGADRVKNTGVNNLAVQVPVRVLVADSTYPVRVMALNVDVVPLDGSPALTSPVVFNPSAGLGSPWATNSQGANNYSGAWLNSGVAGVSNTTLLGTLTVTLPAGVTASSAYAVHFDHFSASPNGIALFHSTVQDGLITVGERSGSSWNDGIPDWWRLQYFGTVSNLLSAANLDPDGDGASNWEEYVAGTNPMDPTSVLQLAPSAPAPNNFIVQWPSVLGKTYLLQSSTSLFSTNWSVIASNLVGTGQMMQFQDSSTPATPARFYRAKVQ
jgi:sugar lactone lactonase YvrE